MSTTQHTQTVMYRGRVCECLAKLQNTLDLKGHKQRDSEGARGGRQSTAAPRPHPTPGPPHPQHNHGPTTITHTPSRPVQQALQWERGVGR